MKLNDFVTLSGLLLKITEINQVFRSINHPAEIIFTCDFLEAFSSV